MGLQSISIFWSLLIIIIIIIIKKHPKKIYKNKLNIRLELYIGHQDHIKNSPHLMGFGLYEKCIRFLFVSFLWNIILILNLSLSQSLPVAVQLFSARSYHFNFWLHFQATHPANFTVLQRWQTHRNTQSSITCPIHIKAIPSTFLHIYNIFLMIATNFLQFLIAYLNLILALQ